MKGRHLRPLYQRIRAQLPSLAIKGPLLFEQPIGDVLHGVFCESSAFSKDRFFVWVFVQPLYVPRSEITLTFGERVGGNSRTWRMEPSEVDELTESLLGRAPEFWNRYGSAALLIDCAKELVGDSSHIGLQEAVALSLALVGQDARAKVALDRLQAQVRQISEQPPWLAEALARWNALEACLGARSAAHDVLVSWRADTLHALGLGRSAMDPKA